MILKQYYLGCLSQASYLVADESTGQAAVVDPRRDVDVYLREARDLGLEIRHVLLTHFHADFVSGHLELRRAVGADIRMGSKAEAEFPIVPMGDGESLSLGTVRLVALETPGHTPESVCWLVFDDARDRERPHAVLTGDTLFIGDVGRPDLMASVGVSSEFLAARLYDSLQVKLLTLPDETLVYPGHGAGSMCGKSLSSETVSTLGIQRRLNPSLAPMTREAFIDRITKDQPAAPAYFAYDAVYNRRERPTLEENLARVLVPLSIERVLELRDAGGQLLDTRDPSDFARGCVPGSVNIGLEGAFATWAGTLLDRERPVVILAEPGREAESALRLGRIGLDRVAGYLEGGPGALARSHLRHADRVSAEGLAARLRGPDPPIVLDVRNAGERDAKHIPGSLHLPLDQLRTRLGDVPRRSALVAQCAAGYRSSMAASILRAEGWGEATDLAGGIQAWEEAGLPLVTPARPSK